MTGKEFSDIRKRLKKTQKTLPLLIGHAFRTIQDWEASAKVPDYAEKVILLLQDKLLNSNTEKIDSEEIQRLNRIIDVLMDERDDLRLRLRQYEEKPKTGTH